MSSFHISKHQHIPTLMGSFTPAEEREQRVWAILQILYEHATEIQKEKIEELWK